MESVQTDLELKRALHDKLDRKIEKWAQSFSFMVVFARRALVSTQLVPQVTKYIRQNVEECGSEVELATKIVRVLFALPHFSPSFSKASAKLKKRQRRKKHRDIMVKEEKAR